MKTFRLVKSKHQIHILNGLTTRSLQEIISYRVDGKLAPDFFQKDKALIRVHHLLDINHLSGDLREWMADIAGME